MTIGAWFPGGVTLDVLAAGTRADPFSGDAVADDWDRPRVVTTHHGVAFFPEPSADLPALDRPERVQDTFTAMLPFNTPCRAQHRLRVHGTGPYAGVWDVDGAPRPWQHPLGWKAVTAATVRRITG